MSRKLTYAQDGRSGYVIYQDSLSDIRFYFEFGGNNCVAIIDIPNKQEWLAATGRAEEERDEIIQYVAAKATHDQTHNGYFRITDNSILIYS